MNRIALVHYGEIALKGKNRPVFEKALVQNIQNTLEDQHVSVKNLYGRILLTLSDDTHETVVKRRLARVFGIENFAFGVIAEKNMDAIEETAANMLSGIERDWRTFRVTAKRADKDFPKTSIEIGKDVGAACLRAVSDEKSVDLHNPDVIINVEVTNREAYVTTTKINGPGGLPVGVSGTVVCLLSGGIDSPVAAWQLMKRGCDVVFVHFHSVPQTSKASVAAVRELAELLAPWQRKNHLIEVPFLDIQKEIMKTAKDAYRVLLYRRFMFRIAEKIAQKNSALVLVTGESVGQVASQTLENIAAISDAVAMPIFRPLIGFNKQEIITVAKRIGTFEISTVGYEDCCSLFMPEYPVTKASIDIARQEEAKLNIDNLVSDAVSRAEHNTASD